MLAQDADVIVVTGYGDVEGAIEAPHGKTRLSGRLLRLGGTSLSQGCPQKFEEFDDRDWRQSQHADQ